MLIVSCYEPDKASINNQESDERPVNNRVKEQNIGRATQSLTTTTTADQSEKISAIWLPAEKRLWCQKQNGQKRLRKAICQYEMWTSRGGNCVKHQSENVELVIQSLLIRNPMPGRRLRGSTTAGAGLRAMSNCEGTQDITSKPSGRAF